MSTISERQRLYELDKRIHNGVMWLHDQLDKSMKSKIAIIARINYMLNTCDELLPLYNEYISILEDIIKKTHEECYTLRLLKCKEDELTIINSITYLSNAKNDFKNINDDIFKIILSAFYQFYMIIDNKINKPVLRIHNTEYCL